MNLDFIKIFLLSLILLFLSNCSKIKSVNVTNSIKRIDVYNANDTKNNVLKSFYKKFDKDTKEWYPCIFINSSKICNFTNIALNKIRVAKLNTNQEQSNSNQEQSNSNQEQSNSNQEQSNSNQEQSNSNQEQSNSNQEQLDDQYENRPDDHMHNPPGENNQCNGGFDVC